MEVEEVDEEGEAAVGGEGESGVFLVVAGVDGGTFFDEQAADGDVPSTAASMRRVQPFWLARLGSRPVSRAARRAGSSPRLMRFCAPR